MLVQNNLAGIENEFPGPAPATAVTSVLKRIVRIGIPSSLYKVRKQNTMRTDCSGSVGNARCGDDIRQ